MYTSFSRITIVVFEKERKWVEVFIAASASKKRVQAMTAAAIVSLVERNEGRMPIRTLSLRSASRGAQNALESALIAPIADSSSKTLSKLIATPVEAGERRNGQLRPDEPKRSIQAYVPVERPEPLTKLISALNAKQKILGTIGRGVATIRRKEIDITLGMKPIKTRLRLDGRKIQYSVLNYWREMR